MSEWIPSKSIESGRNSDAAMYSDHNYVRCMNCGFICHKDRDFLGEKTTTVQTVGLVKYDTSSVTYDGVSSGIEAAICTYDGYRPGFEVTQGCPFCGSKLYWE